MQQRVRPARREPILILPTPVRVTRTAAQRRVPGFVIGRSPSKHSGNGRPPPTEVTMRDSPYDDEEEVDPWFAQEVAIECKDFVDEILEELPDAIQMTTETSLAISRDSNPISCGGSNADCQVPSTPNWQSVGTPMQTAAENPMRTAADNQQPTLEYQQH
jgi:hypothetical protein